ncbi:STAS-like domain-containing protein [Pseudothauera rhizosphaerae]|uniref:DUF4325 domain-containing protein n=1 Tax=Pseudothauera rhizosphaerae TaxID=2565932 RepID=A0A4S4B2Z1_9RHOO|nr:STAS-like domain-containing protein [Pseudothauera rhizosphaerae]THF65281.1 DUF4325 domain-containing protein [Pseudothauera rhizosphaerae]
MTTVMLAERAVGGRLLGSRPSAHAIRDLIEATLQAGDQVVLDFAGTDVTQSFIDELVGVLVLERGEDVLQSLVFRNCSPDTQTILHFVVSDRLDQLSQSRPVH